MRMGRPTRLRGRWRRAYDVDVDAQGHWRRPRTIASRLLFWFLAIALMPMVAVAAQIFVTSQQALRKEVIRELETFADERERRIDEFARVVLHNAKKLGENEEVVEAYGRLEKAYKPGVGDQTDEFEEAEKFARRVIANETAEFVFADLLLLNPGGIALYSDRHTREPGVQVAPDPARGMDLAWAIDRARRGLEPRFSDFATPPKARAAVAYVAAPILRKGQPAGVLAVQIDIGLTSQLRAIVEEQPGMESSEVLVGARRDGEIVLLMTPPGAKAGASEHAPRGEPHLVSLDKALKGESGHGLVGDPRDPGDEVLAAWRPIDRLRWGLVVDVDPDDAFAAIDQLRQVVAGAVGATLLVVVFVAMLVARSISRPIVELTRGVREVAGGDLSREVAVVGRDELALLGRAFNKMTGDLRHIYRTIEDQVRERTDELRQTELKVTYLLNATAEAITAVDKSGVCTFCNPACIRLLGYADESELVGRRLHDLIHHTRPDGRPQAFDESPISRALWLGENVHVEGDTFWRADGSRFEVEYWAHPLRDDDRGVFGAVVNFLDITERTRAREQILRAKEVAEAANRAKSQFLANMSHELRTPLNAVIGYSEMLVEEAQEAGQDAFIPDLEKIRAAGRHLLDLISSVLDLSKIEAGKMELHLEDFDLGALALEVAGLVEPLAAKNGNTLDVAGAADAGPIRADLTKVRQSLFNLLSNACKFTSHGTIGVSAAREVDGEGREWVALAVRDDGIGLSPDQLARIFEAFTQGDASTTRKYGGTGLGLAISRKSCQMMGGDIAVASMPGRGSTFTIRLPTSPDDPSPRPAAGPPPEPGATVLVVDDDPAARDLIRRTLEHAGYRVEVADGGRTAIERAREVRPDAITLDVAMPDLDGWMVLNALKADPDLAEIPVLMLTVVDAPEHARQLGAADVLTKPLDRARLLDRLRACRAAAGLPAPA